MLQIKATNNDQPRNFMREVHYNLDDDKHMTQQNFFYYEQGTNDFEMNENNSRQNFCDNNAKDDNVSFQIEPPQTKI